MKARESLAYFERVFNEAVATLNTWSGSDRLFEPILTAYQIPGKD